MGDAVTVWFGCRASRPRPERKHFLTLSHQNRQKTGHIDIIEVTHARLLGEVPEGRRRLVPERASRLCYARNRNSAVVNEKCMKDAPILWP